MEKTMQFEDSKTSVEFELEAVHRLCGNGTQS